MLKLSDEQKFWLRQPEHFFVPVQIELYKKYGKILEATDEFLLEWMRPEQRQTWATLKSRLPEAEGEVDRGIVLLDTAATPNQSFLLGRGGVTNKKSVVTLGFLQILTRSASATDFHARAKNRIGRNSKLEHAADGAPGTTYQRAALAEWLTDVEQGAGGLLAGRRQPDVATSFRRGTLANSRRLRDTRGQTGPSRTARLAGRRARSGRLTVEAASSPDRD